jgi:hypothetical protein
MYKYKKITINFITTIYILLSILEVILYLFAKNNLFGLIYMYINLFVILKFSIYNAANFNI